MMTRCREKATAECSVLTWMSASCPSSQASGIISEGGEERVEEPEMVNGYKEAESSEQRRQLHI